MYGKASIGLLKNKLTMEHVLFNLIRDSLVIDLKSITN